jgi:hypothetical protein
VLLESRDKLARFSEWPSIGMLGNLAQLRNQRLKRGHRLSPAETLKTAPGRVNQNRDESEQPEVSYDILRPQYAGATPAIR